MKYPVLGYRAIWDTKAKQGVVGFHLGGENTHDLTLKDPAEFGSVLLMLSQGHVTLDSQTFVLELEPRQIPR